MKDVIVKMCFFIFRALSEYSETAEGSRNWFDCVSLNRCWNGSFFGWMGEICRRSQYSQTHCYNCWTSNDLSTLWSLSWTPVWAFIVVLTHITRNIQELGHAYMGQTSSKELLWLSSVQTAENIPSSARNGEIVFPLGSPIWFVTHTVFRADIEGM